jgi:predicted secreted Zn-dependent protease
MGPRREAVAIFAAISLAACSAKHGALDLGPSPPGVLVSPTIAYYDITANTLGELRRAMVTVGPASGGRRWAATTGSRLTWQYRRRTTPVGCEIYEVKLRVLTTITFPRWNPVAPPDSTLQVWWDEFTTGLAEHEKGHAQISIKAASELRSALDGMTSVTCDAVGIQASNVARRITDAMRDQQTAYDESTRHGGTQIERVRRLREP